MDENLKQVVGHVTLEVNAAINDYAKKHNKKKIGLIGEIITNFVKEEGFEPNEKRKTSIKEKASKEK